MPLGIAVAEPFHRFNESPIFMFTHANVGISVLLQERSNRDPLSTCEADVCHIINLPNSSSCQQNLVS